MAGNPFAGQGITGLYDAPLKAAADLAGNKIAASAANKRTFASLIGAGISTANSAIQSGRNREMQNLMNREDNLAQVQRLEKNKELNLQYQNDLMKQKDDFSNTNVGALMETFHDIDTTAIDPETAVAMKKMKIQTGLSMNPESPQLRGLAKQVFGLDDVGLEAMIGGEDAPTDTPYFNITRDVVKSRIAGDKADSTKKVFDSMKVELEVGEKEEKVALVKNQNQRMMNFLETENLTPDEKLDFTNLAQIRSKELSTPQSAGKFLRDGDTFLTNRNRLVEYTETMSNLEEKFIKLQKAGVELNIAPIKNAIYETIGDADAASVQDFITKLKEEDFYLSGGKLSAQEMDDMRRDILVDVNKIISGTAFIGKAFLGQTGTQTEPDFAHNLAAVFLPGQSLDVRVKNLNEGRMKFDSNLIQQSYLFGDPDFAGRRLRKFHDGGATFNEFGAAKKVPGFGTPAQGMSSGNPGAAFSTEKGVAPDSMQYPTVNVNYAGETVGQELPDMTQDSGYNSVDGSLDGEDPYQLIEDFDFRL